MAVGDKVEVTVGVARWRTVSMAVHPNQVPGDRSNSLVRVGDRRFTFQLISTHLRVYRTIKGPRRTASDVRPRPRCALLEQPDEENPAQTKTNNNLEHDKCSHNNKQEVRRAALHTTPRVVRNFPLNTRTLVASSVFNPV